MKTLDMGCGPDPYRKTSRNEQVITLDSSKEIKPDVVWDLNKFPYPFKKNTFNKVYASHILEHLDDVFKVMEEIYRICKPNATIIIRVPHFSCIYAHSIAHKHFFRTTDFDLHFTGDVRYSKSKFKVVEKRLSYYMKTYGESRKRIGKWWARLLHPIAWLFEFFANANITFCERVWCYWVGGFGEIYFKLKVIK